MMKIRVSKVAVVVTVAVCVLVMNICVCTGGRVPPESVLLLQSLRGSSVGSGPSGCTYTPGGGGPACPINGRKVAGSGFKVHLAGDYLRLFIKFGVKSSQK
ncbi:hypothetical protein Scep_029798 [Stephania cephalantha]|uniref:Uncharacterized protein n=1 Tax=Stephania cephalantha TaxID=152367 RepID=A0AAP0E2W4_9MAGN